MNTEAEVVFFKKETIEKTPPLTLQKGAESLLKRYYAAFSAYAAIDGESSISWGFSVAVHQIFEFIVYALQHIHQPSAETLARVQNFSGYGMRGVDFSYKQNQSTIRNLELFLNKEDHAKVLNTIANDDKNPGIAKLITSFQKDIQQLINLKQGILPQNFIQRCLLLREILKNDDLLKCITPALFMLSIEVTKPPIYILRDARGNNSVTDIVRIEDGYKLIGENSAGDERTIIIDDAGVAKREDGSSDLGIVGKQMFIQCNKIKAHFGLEPEPKADTCLLM